MARASRYDDVKGSIINTIGTSAIGLGRAPAVRDLAQQYEVSVSTMHSWLKKLADEGLIEWRRARHRSLRLTSAGLEAFQPF